MKVAVFLLVILFSVPSFAAPHKKAAVKKPVEVIAPQIPQKIDLDIGGSILKDENQAGLPKA